MLFLCLNFPHPGIDLYFINNTPELVGGSVSAEFAANRPGLEISCHLTHLDEFGFKQDCKLEDTHMTCGSVIDRMAMDAWL